MSQQVRSDAIGEASDIRICHVRLAAELLMQASSETRQMPEPPFEEIKELCSERPPRFYRRIAVERNEALEDAIDVENALESLKEPGSVRLDDFKKELGI
jgi:hypothetical protein